MLMLTAFCVQTKLWQLKVHNARRAISVMRSFLPAIKKDFPVNLIVALFAFILGRGGSKLFSNLARLLSGRFVYPALLYVSAYAVYWIFLKVTAKQMARK